MITTCPICSKKFTAKVNRISVTGYTKYCSIKCSHKRPIKNSTRAKMRTARLGVEYQGHRMTVMATPDMRISPKRQYKKQVLQAKK